MMIHHTPEEPVGGAISPTAPIREILSHRPLRVETYSRIGLMGKRYYWRVRHTSNGETMAQHHGYWRTEDRDHAVDVLWPDLKVDALG